MKLAISKTNQRILFASSLIAAGVFYVQTIRPYQKEKKRREQEEIANFVYKTRYPHLANPTQPKAE